MEKQPDTSLIIEKSRKTLDRPRKKRAVLLHEPVLRLAENEEKKEREREMGGERERERT